MVGVAVGPVVCVAAGDAGAVIGVAAGAAVGETVGAVVGIDVGSKVLAILCVPLSHAVSTAKAIKHPSPMLENRCPAAPRTGAITLDSLV